MFAAVSAQLNAYSERNISRLWSRQTAQFGKAKPFVVNSKKEPIRVFAIIPVKIKIKIEN